MSKVSSVVLIFIIANIFSFANAQTTSCIALTTDAERSTKSYIEKRNKIPHDTSLTLLSDEVVGHTCYHRLTYEGRNAVGAWKLILYLSPDLRFLSSDLLDTSEDPIQERKRREEKLMHDLTSPTNLPSIGAARAPITIVEFSDFECPYCRQLNDVLEHEVLPKVRGEVRLVFRHLPLPIHSWARAAAEGAACAGLQSDTAFWMLHDHLFDNQRQINEQNIKQEILLFSRDIPELDRSAFQNCLDNEMSLGVVLRDLNAAETNGIKATPTLFINGIRIEGLKSGDELLQVISSMEKPGRVSDN